mgnify:CR=1 FL=1
MRAKEFVSEHKKGRKAIKHTIKPRTGHAPTQTGAGAHKDKKKAEKQGDVKHKKDHAMEAYGRPDFKVDGWTYISDVEEEEDNRKIFHTAISPEGKRIDMDFSPYERLDPETFKMWIKLGQPDRGTSRGPLHKTDIVQMARIHGIAHLDPQMANAGKKTEAGGFVDVSNMSSRDVQRLGHEDDDTPSQYGVFINGKLWKKFATRDEANRVSLSIERKYGKPTKVHSL